VWVEASGAELVDLRLQLGDLAGGENPGRELAAEGVRGRVLHDHRPGREVDVGLDQIEDVALPRCVAAVILEDVLDVVEPADGPEADCSLK
jgi:hypothetical protein